MRVVNETNITRSATMATICHSTIARSDWSWTFFSILDLRVGTAGARCSFSRSKICCITGYSGSSWVMSQRQLTSLSGFHSSPK